MTMGIPMDSMTTERARSSFNGWYDRNAEAYNAERRRRYQVDAEVREKARKAAAEYRRRVSGGTGELPALRNGLHTSARVAAALGVSTQTLRNWEARGLIPEPSISSKHRLYTEGQVNLLKKMVEASDSRAEFEVARTNLFVEWEDAGVESESH